MRTARVVPLLLAIVALAGCDAIPAKSTARRAAEVAPKLDDRSNLRLTRFGRELAVGDPAERVNEVFPAATGAYAFSDLPAILGDGFESRGWETSSEGFGAIFSEGRVALAMRQFPNVDRDRADDLQATLERTNGRNKPVIVTGPNVEFRFWEDGTALLMFLKRTVKEGKYDVTEAVGDSQVMGVLGMNPAKARTSVQTLTAPVANGSTGSNESTEANGSKAGRS